MAPIYAAAIGITPQIIDDVKLQNLKDSLTEIKLLVPLHRTYSSSEDVIVPLDIDRLVSLLEPHQEWIFEEQVDLQEWIEPLNRIDACLSYYIQKFPSLLLIGPVQRTKSRGAVRAPDQFVSNPAESVEDVANVPATVNKNLCTIIQFLAVLLLNSSNKSVFNSVEELVDLLAAADDGVASVALEALCNLSTPPALHKQQAAETQTHSTALHNSRTTSHKRLIALARGWGTRGSGLGLYTCSTADDSEFGQGTLPKEAGDLNFAFFRSTDSDDKQTPANDKAGDDETEELGESFLVKISLHAVEILEDNGMAVDSSNANALANDANSKQKRRRVAPVTHGEKSIRSTADLFFQCLNKVGGRNMIPEDRLFPLLADIRLTRSFHCRATRVSAVERRLRALVTILHSHPSHDIMSGYFQAQPELCVELIDLLRPTVSSAAVSATSSQQNQPASSPLKQDAISALANSPTVPYGVRKLALEALTALVAHRDGASGNLTGVARHSNVLSELGVGKGQYLGLLPTLIRFSLASLGSFLVGSEQKSDTTVAQPDMRPEDAIAFEVGLAFVGATMPPPLPRVVQLERALEFIDSVLTLTAAVVATPSGTSALTDCGLIPALLATVAVDHQELVKGVTSETSSDAEAARINALLRFVTAQAVQILEGALVTHNNALAAFHDLQGVEVLTNRLSKEILESRQEDQPKSDDNNSPAGAAAVPMDCGLTSDVTPAADQTDDMDTDSPPADKDDRLQSSQRVLLFSIVTCLTVVFHQESTSSSVSAPSGAAQIRKPELTKALIKILDNVDGYGGHLAALIATLMSDVMNSDPHVVHHVHQSGLATSFLKMLTDESEGEPILPAVPELVMAIPNVLSALALTEDGASALEKADPFPALFRLFYHPKYAMPRSRCLLNEMTAIVGTGLDEIMRHVNSMRPPICAAIASAMNKVAEYGEALSQREAEAEAAASSTSSSSPASGLENERSCLMQYVLNFGQILEQILHNEDHCEPFVAAGGLDALLKLYPYLMSTGKEFLAHISCLSCPSVSTITHSTTEDSLSLAFKCIAMKYDSFRLLQTLINVVNHHLAQLEKYQSALRQAFPVVDYGNATDIDAHNILEGLPRQPLHELSGTVFDSKIPAVAAYLRQVVTVQWATSLLGAAIKASCQKSQEGTGWTRNEREWKKEISSTAFEELMGRISRFHQSAIFEVCRIRTETDFDQRDAKRLEGVKSGKLRYRLRIVCPEGAVVRDGIEIDSCASVGNMEMGEIADAFDRCVNSSGVLRYRTRRGWVSEQTRGHGREPIAEVLNVWEESDDATTVESPEPVSEGRVEAGISDVCSTASSVLARLQISYSELFSSLTKVVIQGLRSLPVRTISFEQGTLGAHVATIMKILSGEIMQGFNRKELKESMVVANTDAAATTTTITAATTTAANVPSPNAAMYLGCLMGHLLSCLFEEKRERLAVNVPLLVVLTRFNNKRYRQKDGDGDGDGDGDDNNNDNAITFLGAIKHIFRFCLADFESRSTGSGAETAISHATPEKGTAPKQSLSRTTAACFPPATSVLRRLLLSSSITSSPASSVLSRVKLGDLPKLLGEKDLTDNTNPPTPDDEETFSPEKFARNVLCDVSDTVMLAWTDSRFVFSPPHISHPIATLGSETMVSLEEAMKKKTTTAGAPTRNAREEGGIWGPFRGLLSGNGAFGGQMANPAAEEFEPSEDAITRLVDMGFTREHALEAIFSTRSNSPQIAMEHALSHPPPSPASIERRRTELEAIRSRRRDQEQQQQQDNNANNNNNNNENNNNDDDEGEEANNNNESTGQPADNGSGQDGGTGGDTTASMDVEVETAEPSEEEKAPKKDEDETVTKSKQCIEDWKGKATEIACSILAGSSPSSDDAETRKRVLVDSGSGQGDGETEALTVVLCSFLLDICQRYPEKRETIATNLLKHLKAQLVKVSDGDETGWKVKDGCEVNFASLCHGAVLFTRALPKLRTLVLKENLIGCIISCINGAIGNSNAPAPAGGGEDPEKAGDVQWPIWLAPSILLLDVMAQPVVAFSEIGKKKKDDATEVEETPAERTELDQVRDEHKKKATAISVLANDLFTALYAPKSEVTETKQQQQQQQQQEEDTSQTKEPKTDGPPNGEGANSNKKVEKATVDLPFGSVPAYFPLLFSQSSDSCVEICLRLLGRRDPSPPPGVIHGTLLLLLRLLRTPKTSSHCLKNGAAEKILSLPRDCRFTGHSGLVTLILRRLLEDEPTLQSAMETEIRAAIMKLHGKKDGSSSEKEKAAVPRRAFVQAITPLLCRDPESFLKAVAVSVRFEGRNSDSSSEQKVTLLTSAERSKHVKIASEVLKKLPSGKTSAHRRSSTRKQRRDSNPTSRSKTPTRSNRRGSTPKRTKKDKNDSKDRPEEDAKSASQNATTVTQVTSILINHIVQRSSHVPAEKTDSDGKEKEKDAFGFDETFLWTANVIEILADLVLAMPSCATAIHRHKPTKSRDRSYRLSLLAHPRHALYGCPSPPKTFVSFLLHQLLPQDRWSTGKDRRLLEAQALADGENVDELKAKRKAAQRRTKVAQSTARLIVALVARPGEGRRRVISELSYALSGGQLGLSSAAALIPAEKAKLRRNANELHALRAWGELCIGLAAPRSNGNNYDSNSTLSFDVVKIMLEAGMAHALLLAIHRVPLHHPMATNTVGQLILPFEILSRPSVTDLVKTTVEKELAAKDAKSTPKASKTPAATGLDNSNRHDSFADDTLLEDAFGADPARNHNMDVAIDDSFVSNDESSQSVHDEAGRRRFIVAGDDHGEDDDEVHAMEIDDDMEEVESEEDMSSSDDDDDSSDDSDDDDDDDDEDDDDDDDDDQDDDDGEEVEESSMADESEDSNSGEEFEHDGDFHLDYREDELTGQGYEPVDDGGVRGDGAIDEGWTRIETSGFGGMLMGAGRGMGRPFVAGGANMSARTRGFVETAEAMIGTLLRTGEIPGDALAEIEGSLGIRIMQGGRGVSLTRVDMTNRGEAEAGDPFAPRPGGAPNDRNRREAVGTLPHINQRSQPDVGYSGLGGGGGRWNEISSMEYVFGGPSITAGSRNYDLVTPLRMDNDDESTTQPSSVVDIQLFPGGPASATHARTQYALHPLLCGVDLPPANSLVSDLLPHGVRATRRGQMTTRRPGDWTNTSIASGGFLVSTSNGNIIRSNRNHNGGPLSNGPRGARGAPGPVGWSDDGLPFDGTIEEFRSAFEQALGQSMIPPDPPAVRNTTESTQNQDDAGTTTIATSENQQTEGQADATMSDPPTENGETPAAAAAAASEASSDPSPDSQPTEGRAEQEIRDTNEAAETDGVEGTDDTNTTENNNADNDEAATNRDQDGDGDGDRVASSLATALRLSPNNEEQSVSTEQPANAPMEDTTTATAREEVQPEQQQQQQQQQQQDGDGQAEVTSGEANQEGAMDTSNDEPNEESAGAADGSAAAGGGATASASATTNASSVPELAGLVCPPDMDPEVFSSLPVEMQLEVVEQARAEADLAAQLDSTSSLDPEVLAALPEEMRREVIEQERQERRLREAPADPANAEEMDNASFVASLAPELRNEILMTADDAFLQSLPPNIIAEAQILRERASANRRVYEEPTNAANDAPNNHGTGDGAQRGGHAGNTREQTDGATSSRRKQRAGKIKAENDREAIVYCPPTGAKPLTSPVSKTDLKALLRFLYLLSPVRPHRLLQKVFQNLCMNKTLRCVLSSAFVKLLHDDSKGALMALDSFADGYGGGPDEWRVLVDGLFSDALKDFPPAYLIGAAPEVLDTDGLNPNITLLRRKQTNDTAASIAANLPMSAKGSRHDHLLPPVVATRLVDLLQNLCKGSPRFCLDMLVSTVDEKNSNDGSTGFEKLLDLLEKPRYSKSSANLEQLLILLESAASPLSHLSKHADDEVDISQKDIDAAAAVGKEWVEVPRVVISQNRLQLLCSILRMETCRDVSFTKVNTIARRLCRIDANRGYVLAELASVASALGSDAIRDLKALGIRLSTAVKLNQEQLAASPADETKSDEEKKSRKNLIVSGSASSSVAVSTSTSELKLLRVLQTLQALCADMPEESSSKKGDGTYYVTEEMVQLLKAMNLDDLWKELTACLKIVQVLEGVNIEEDADNKANENEPNDGDEENTAGGKKLQNSVAGLLTRFLPSIEAFFVANASSTRNPDKSSKSGEQENESNADKESGSDDPAFKSLVGGSRLVDFVDANKVLLNALIRNNSSLLDKGLKALIQVPRCRHLLDFDVKRHWFKTQVRRLRQHANRRHGSLRLHIRRRHVFEDAYHNLRVRNADEMRGRLHVTFRNEDGVDAGGLSREFFGILAKEIFNPNYALFTSTEDGSTFQPNPNSSINPDHLSYFRFVGRIVGKAVSDGYLLDAHFTRSLYKHMLGVKPTHHDMEAIDPDYYKNLKTILEYNLGDLGLDLTFSIEDHSFGRNRIVDLIPDGRNVAVTEENKAKYVSLVCQNRMTTAISSQTKAYLDGFYELVSPELIAIFTPRELELLISGLPDIDVHDLKKNTDYVGWKATDKQIQWFWNVLFSLSRNQKAAFLQFVTGSSKVPLAGFGELPGMRGVQKFSIHKTSGSSGALMSAHTCFNSLDLPVYDNEEELREKLLYAITEGSGTFLMA